MADLNSINNRIYQIESERAREQQAERERVAKEEAHRRAVADADRELAMLRAMQAQAELDTQIAHANVLVEANHAAVRALEDVLAQLVTTILDTLHAPQNAAQRSYQTVTDANDIALNAGLNLANFVAPLPPAGANGHADFAQADHERNAVMNAYGQARRGVPSPFRPDMAALEGMSRETDPERRRVWAALHHVISGADRLVHVTERYSVMDDARQRERARTGRTF